MSLWPVIGHEWAIELLAQAIKGGRPSHAYLFTGLSQVGKTTLARLSHRRCSARPARARRAMGR